MRDAFITELTTIAHEDKNVILLTADLGFGVLDKFRKELPKQFINVGIAEQNMIGLATGLAFEGYIVYCYSIANFPTLRCLEQIRNDAAYHQANVKIVSVGGGLSYGPLGMSHHATEDLAILRVLPGVQVLVPSTLREASAGARHLYKTPGVQYFRLDKSFAKDSVETGEIDLNSWKVLTEGNEICIVSVGGILEETILAREILLKEGVKVRLVSATNLTPNSIEMVMKSISHPKLLISVEEHVTSGGLGGLLAEIISGLGENIRLIRLGIQPEFVSTVGSQKYLRNIHGISAIEIARVVSAAKYLY
jgi:transketolase